MKINFIIPFISLSGGIKAVFEWANGLCKLGHKVNVIYPFFPYYFGNNILNYPEWINWLYRLFKENILIKKPIWFNKDILFDLKKVVLLNDFFIPDADITIATSWPTAYDVKRLNFKKGKKLYCVFHYEKEGGGINKINNSYRLGLPMFTISQKTVQSIRDTFGKKIDNIVPCGIDKSEFLSNDFKKDWQQVLLYYDPNIRKGGNDGIEALKIINKNFKDVKFKIFYGIRKPFFEATNVEYVKRPISTENLNNLYNSAGVFIYPSRYEGFGMPPLEAAFCKCAVVTTDVGAVRDYFINNCSAMIVKPSDPLSLANAVVDILKNRELAIKLSVNGFNAVQKADWQTSVFKLEKVLYETIRS